MLLCLSRCRAITWTNWCGDFVNMNLQWQTSVQFESKYERSLSKCFNCKMLIIIMINERLVTSHGDIKCSHRWFRQRFVTGRLLPESMLTNHQWGLLAFTIARNLYVPAIAQFHGANELGLRYVTYLYSEPGPLIFRENYSWTSRSFHYNE